ncbi:MAG: hypothetical protein HY867_11620 [Chloroflexi bacterium]|nr:hypothetical protein [Chloroflexota bacterium]
MPNLARLRTFQRVPRTEWTRSLAGMMQAEAKRKETISHGRSIYESPA